MKKPRFNRLADWLAWQESYHPRAIDPGLERVGEVAARLGLTQVAPRRVAIVAGTNGKGTAATGLAALLSASGASVGLYTSPHLRSYNERIQLEGQLATDAQLMAAFAAIDEARGEISLSYFEFGTLAAAWLFQQAELEYWVLEVGLGGRLDATNVFNAGLAIITPIGIDHTEWLGTDLETIGAEKAGVLRSGATAVLAEIEPPASVRNGASRCGEVLRAGHDFGWREVDDGLELWVKDQRLAPFRTDLPPPSLAAATAAAMTLTALTPAAAQAALAQLRMAGRWQRLEVGGRELIIDVGHNAHGFAYLARRAAPLAPLTVVVGMLANKDARAALAALAPVVKRWVVCDLPNESRAMSAADLAAVCPIGAEVELASSPVAGLELALATSEPILVVGSFVTAAAVLTQFEGRTSRG